MKFNVHNVDRSFRWVIGLTIMAFALAYHSDWYLLGVAISISGLVGYCPLYTVLGIDTKNGSKKPEKATAVKGHTFKPAH